MRSSSFLLIFLVGSTLRAQPVGVRFDPSRLTTNVAVGDSFRLAVVLNSTATFVRGTHLKIEFSDTVLTPGRVDLGTLFTQTSAAYFFDYHTDTRDSSLVLDAAVLGYGRYFNGPGVLFWISFHALGVGDIQLIITELNLFDVDGDSVEAEGFAGYVKVAQSDEWPPGPVTHFTATAGRDGHIFLSWHNPDDFDFRETMIRRKVGEFPNSHTDGDIVYAGPAEGFHDTRLQQGITFYYQAYSYDDEIPPNYSSGVGDTATTQFLGTYAAPNPFNPDRETVKIAFMLEEDARLTIEIFDAFGRRVITLIEDEFIWAREQNQVFWDGENQRGDQVANGVYIYRLRTNRGYKRIGKIGVVR
ncbi:hypothetical protein ISS37_02650 [candidate division KSB1 bacterium]|nr:hypothetical protein [candidate division KSB1 bacterium]